MLNCPSDSHAYIDRESVGGVEVGMESLLIMMRRGREAITPASWLFVSAVVMMMAAATSVSGKLHVVGGNKANGWRTDLNYTEWSSKERFYVGDWLYFGFSNRYLYSVLQVNKTSYDNCDAEHWIKNATGGAGRDVFELKEPKTYYFISRGGFCYHGMKLALLTEQSPPPPPPPAQPHSPAKSGSPANFGTNKILMIPIGLLACVTYILSCF